MSEFTEVSGIHVNRVLHLPHCEAGAGWTDLDTNDDGSPSWWSEFGH